ncbi:MAG TPA: twin-arginine translocase TatA/TatE family subunit [Ktedonobacterales bacterium]
MGFGHLPEILGLLVLGLIIFGPKRMIELGSQLGRTFREFQSAMKEMSWNPLSDDDDKTSSAPQTTLGKLSQLAQTMSAPRATEADGPSGGARVVDAAAPAATLETLETAEPVSSAHDAPADAPVE